MSRALTLDEAADALRVSKRWLQYWLADHPVDSAGMPFYVPMGRNKTFEESDITRIRSAIRREEQCRLNSIGVKGYGIIEEQLAQLASDAVSVVPAKPRAKTSPRARLPRWKASTGKVISMGQRQS